MLILDCGLQEFRGRDLDILEGRAVLVNNTVFNERLLAWNYS
jgi:hypothetical protein